MRSPTTTAGPLRFSAPIEPTLRTCSRYKLHSGSRGLDGPGQLPSTREGHPPACSEPELARLRDGCKRQHAVEPTAVEAAKSPWCHRGVLSSATDDANGPAGRVRPGRTSRSSPSI